MTYVHCSSGSRDCTSLLPQACRAAQLQVHLTVLFSSRFHCNLSNKVSTTECIESSCVHPHGACSGAHGVQQKLYNWNTMNQRVFKKLDFVLAKRECEAVVNCDPGAVERVLKLVKIKVEAYTEKQSQKPRCTCSLQEANCDFTHNMIKRLPCSRCTSTLSQQRMTCQNLSSTH